MLEEYMTVKECAEQWGKTVQAVTLNIRAGKLKATRIGAGKKAVYLIDRIDWRAFVARHGQAAKEAE